MVNRFRLIVVGGALLLAALVWSAPAMHAQPQTPRLWTGVYTEAQATDGEAAYTSTCARCHSVDLAGSQVAANYAPALGGGKFMNVWETRNIDRLFKIIKDTMPRDTPGVLNDKTAIEIVAYILKFNGYPSSATALTADSGLDKMLILPKSGTVKREATNFAVVQVVGCVSRSGDSRWALTQATNPVVAAVAAAGLAPPPTSHAETFRLVNAVPFKVDGQVGRQVKVEGLLRRDPDENLLSVTALAPTGVACGN
jgi:mono/diheme cytochrome c family protein